jgi:hypothetical protein
MTVRVAELESVFTADISAFEQGADVVETRRKDLDGQTATTQVDADAADALQVLDDVLAELRDVESTSARAQVEADVDEAQESLRDLSEELEQVDQTEAVAEVRADVAEVLDDLDKTGTALDDLDDEVARPRIDPAGLEEFNDEASGTAREAAASFDGSAESIGEVFQEVAANAFAGFGPAGAAAGIAAAVGLGTAIAAVQTLAEENTAAKEAATDMATAMVDGTHDARDAFREYATTVVEDNPWTFWSDEASTSLEGLNDDLERLGALGQQTIGAISSGSLEDMRAALADVNDELEVLEVSLRRGADAADFGVGAGELLDLAHNAEVAAQASNGLTEADEQRRESLQRVQGVLEDQIESQSDAREIAVLLIQAEQDLTRAEAELQLELDETNRALEERVSGSRNVAQAEFDLADSVRNTRDTMKDAEATEQDRKEALFELSGNILDLAAAEEEASGKTEDYNRIIDRNRREFMDAAEAAGYTREQAEYLAREYGLIPKRVNTDINGDASGARREGREARDYLNALRATIPVTADTTDAQRRVAEFRASAAANTLRLDGRNFGGFADGAVVDFFANGAENHVAQIAPAGAYRVWAEQETGGEAYIPLAPAKRSRSMDILEEVASRFGVAVVGRADGAVDNPAPVIGPANVNMAATATFTDAQVRMLADAVREGAEVGLAGHEAAVGRKSRYARGI